MKLIPGQLYKVNVDILFAWNVINNFLNSQSIEIQRDTIIICVGISKIENGSRNNEGLVFPTLEPIFIYDSKIVITSPNLKKNPEKYLSPIG